MFLTPVALAVLLQLHLDYELLVAEDARGDATSLIEALSSADTNIQIQAVRALGRFERPELAAHVTPLLDADAAELRMESANALAQMKADNAGIGERLEQETVPEVRAALYESLGRVPDSRESTLVAGLSEADSVRIGAVKGLEALLRTRGVAPSNDAVLALRDAVKDSPSSTIRQLALLALNRAEDRDVETLETAWNGADPQVRRLAILGLGEWRSDPSPMVRYAALRVAPTCEHAHDALTDVSEHVVLLAIDSLGEGCSPDALATLLDSEDWRRSSRALVSLAKVDPAAARKALPRFVQHRVWQARVYAARAARILDDDASLATLRRDPHPNVVGSALVTPGHALDALASDDYELLVRAVGLLEGWDDGASAIPTLQGTLRRITAQKRATSRDPRRGLLERLSEFGDVSGLEYLVDDFDPFIANIAATLTSTEPKTLRFAPSPVPDKEYLDALVGASARVSMKESGSFTLELLPAHAPFTVAQFAKLAETGYYNGLTFHRIAPNFVLQGGSPGANEFVGTPHYIRDEVARLSHERGTLGISTRGRDTGDSQIFINLVDNFRLDHNFTVFARVVEGMDNVDRIQEGDVMTAIEILRR
jgi:cyclophilin family peptidyl-prolyl cis-trans isomerase/HEAT repeat protein